ncbi:hypothetical protein OG394_36700 [Kribbella sp. NBC_01245]|uniref:hypothetical protein n=1 Tax=Kribbella sp. NBC_01245 TaxID=2903578 RepID=UPI002E2DC78E|nr:hypothetical protein [Kribbella sp. NBC_01245]
MGDVRPVGIQFAPCFVRRWETQTDSAIERYVAHHTDTKIQAGKRVWAWFPANTIQTFEIDDIWL